MKVAQIIGPAGAACSSRGEKKGVEAKMQLTPCRVYHGQRVGQSLVKLADGRSVFKVYYISNVGRDTPERFEWAHCKHTREDFERSLLATGIEGIGFAIAFPHVTKLYRFSPSAETVLDVREFHTEGLRPNDRTRADGFHELACYAEAVLVAAEYHAWARAASVEEYLAFTATDADFPVASHTKLAAYWG
jgi:hypothetical protein